MRKSVLAALLAPLALISPATASPNVAVVVGTGTIFPGLPTTGCGGNPNQTVSFDGTAVAVGTHAGVYAVHFEGTSSGCESLGAGAGSGNLSGQITGAVTYSRTGPIVTLSGSGQLNGGPTHAIIAGVCEFIPTSVNPVTTYALACELAVS